MSVLISLESYEAEMAGLVGFRRQLISSLRDSQERFTTEDGFSGNNWTAHIESAGAENAVAKYLNRYWDGGIDTFVKNGDIAGVEVRISQSKQLKVATNDPDDRYVVMVMGKMPRYHLQGFIRAGDAKTRREYFTDPGGYGRRAFFIPMSELRPIEDLPALLAG